MKKTILLLSSLLLSQCYFSQATKAGPGGNTRILATDFIGWNAGLPGDLQIRNNFLNQPISFFTTNAQRVTILGNINPLGTGNSGFVGFNNANPTFNIDGITRNGIPVGFPGPTGGGGHLFLRFRPQNFLTNNPANENEMGLWNFSGNAFAPTFFGHVNSTQTMPGIILLGAIDNAQDVAPTVNANPVHQFRIGKNLNINLTSLSNINEVNNRVAYAWYNGPIIKMMMNAAGRLRIGQNLLIPADLPRNRVEITSSAGATPATNDPYFGTINGSSGLMFTNLTSTDTPVANGVNGVNNTKVLTVDAAGVVVLTDASGVVNANNGLSVTAGTIQLGAACGSGTAATTAAALLNSREIPMNNFNFMFNDNTFGGLSRIGFGYLTGTCTPSGNAKFSVENTSYNVGGGFNTVFNPGPSAFAVGVAGRAESNSGVAVGMQGTGRATSGAIVAIGVDGSATLTTSPRNFGVRATAGQSSGINVGLFATAITSGSVNIAVYGNALSGPITSTVSFPITGSYAGYFNGNVVRTGSDNFSSDQNLKQNIDTIPDAIGIIKQLKPKTFVYKQSSYPSMSLPDGKQYGLIAQETQTVIPELINTLIHPAQYDTLGNIAVPSFTYLALEYQQLTPIIIRAMQQQEKRAEKQDSIIQAMQSQIAALTSSVSSCCSSTAVRTTNTEELNQLNIHLNDNEVIVLNQNTPNPFAEQTTITYNVPEKYGYAQIIFSTIDGRILKTVDLTKKGRGQLNVFANDLGNGLYTYSLVIDGKVIDTKKMVKGE